MKRIILQLAIAVSTFALGVVATALYRFNDLSSPFPSEYFEAPASVASSCFPGRSVKTQVMGRLRYFPAGIFSMDDWQNEFRTDWYSKHLAAMNEPSFLFPDDSQQESYRFLWLRSFHHPVAVRIWSSGHNQFVSMKELNGAGGYEPGKLINDRTHLVTTEKWAEFTRFLQEICYWELPTEDDDLAGTDGAQWILEGMREGRYHIVDRWTPETGSYRKVCLYLLKLSRLKIDPSGDDVY